MSERDTSPTSLSAKYRGAVVEDLQLPPAFCVPATAPLSLALEKAYEREFDQLPVLNANRKPIGYLDVPALKAKFEAGQAGVNDPISAHMVHFHRKATVTRPYGVITPDTPLEVLEAFFVERGVDFALGEWGREERRLAMNWGEEMSTLVFVVSVNHIEGATTGSA